MSTEKPKTVRQMTPVRFQEEVARELGIDLNESAGVKGQPGDKVGSREQKDKEGNPGKKTDKTADDRK